MSNEIKMIGFKIPESATHFVSESNEYRAHFLQVDEAGNVFAEFVPSVGYIGWDFDIEPYPISVDAIPVSAHREISRLIEENKRLREVVVYLSRSKQYSEVDSHYRLDALVSLANRTLKELDGKNEPNASAD